VVEGCEESNVCLGALMGPHVVQDQETTWLLQGVGLVLLGNPLHGAILVRPDDPVICCGHKCDLGKH